MQATVRFPDSNTQERRYILKEIFETRLGLSLEWICEPRHNTVISSGPRCLFITDGFLSTAEAQWLKLESMPADPLWKKTRNPDAARLPVLPTRGERSAEIAEDEDGIRIPFDILGSAFFFLSRYEEVANPVEDQFQRYPAEAAYAVRHGFIDRPVVDEYVALIRDCVKSLWPQHQPGCREFRMEVSHDVDLPLRFRWASPFWLVGGCVKEFLKSKSFPKMMERIACWYHVRIRGRVSKDPYNNFSRIMDCSEQIGLSSAFYFITDRPAGVRDAHYKIDDPFIKQLISDIAARGHEIGIHPSFNSFLDGDQMHRELSRLQTVCQEMGVTQAKWGGRQHYLRWKTPFTYRNWEASGASYDSTMGFAQVAGFRCGTSMEFLPFDLLSRTTLGIVERPLIVMDTTIMNHMGLGTTPQALEYSTKLKNRCKEHRGVFTLLWHNSNLTSEEQWNLYTGILNA